MNTVILRQTYRSTKLEILINNEIISAYSELAVLANRPFSEWVQKILQELDEEIYDAYSVDLYGFTFQYELLKLFQKKSRFCENISFHTIASLYSADYIKMMFKNICSRYNLDTKERTDDIKLYTETPVCGRDGFVIVDDPHADICIVTSLERAFGRISIILSEEDIGIITDGNRVVYRIGSNLIDQFLVYYKTGRVDTLYIEQCLNAFQYANLNQEDAEFVKSVVTDKPVYYIGEIPQTIESGERKTYIFRSYPADAFMILSNNPAVLEIGQSSLNGRDGGLAHIIVKNKSGEIVLNRQIELIEHNYAREIQFISGFSFLKLHEKNRFEIAVLPHDAEDRDCLEWSVEPYSIAQITNDGEITALQAGMATVKVKGKRVEASYVIEIRTGIDGIGFDTQKMRVYTGEKKIIECRIIPENAAVEKLEWSFDNGSIAFCNPSKDGKKCQIVASENYTGTGNLICQDPESGLRAICNIEVTKNKIKELLATIVILLMLIGIASPVFLLLSIVASGYSLWRYWGQKKLVPFWVGGIVSMLVLFMHIMK